MRKSLILRVVAQTVLLGQFPACYAFEESVKDPVATGTSTDGVKDSLICGKILNFDMTGWVGPTGSSDRSVWTSSQMDILSCNLVPGPPQYRTSIKELRENFRSVVSRGDGGLISVDVSTIKNVPCIKTIVKAPWSETAMAYSGTLIFLFTDCQIMMNVLSKEENITGLRSSVIFDKLIGSGEVQLDPETKKPINWAADPYDQTVTGRGLRNKSEDERFDSQFPDHPLSKVRDTLSRIEKSITFSSDAKALEIKFEK